MASSSLTVAAAATTKMPEHREKSFFKVTDLNPHLSCILCGGYFIDATTITECLHSFCRACIVRYLETSKYCPVCEVQIHKTRPLRCIRSDKMLQDIVYKLVPGLYQNEMKKRRELYASQPPEALKESRDAEDRGEGMEDRFIYSTDEIFHLSVDYIHHEGSGTAVDDADSDPQRRFLKCPAALTVFHLKKFIRLKYSIPEKYQVDLRYRDEPLEESYSLMDIAYIFDWKRKGLLNFTYRINERPKKLAQRLRVVKIIQPEAKMDDLLSNDVITAPDTTAPPSVNKELIISDTISEKTVPEVTQNSATDREENVISDSAHRFPESQKVNLAAIVPKTPKVHAEKPSKTNSGKSRKTSARKESSKRSSKKSRSSQGTSKHSQGTSKHSQGTSKHSQSASKHSQGTSKHSQGASKHSQDASKHLQGASKHSQGASKHSQGASKHSQGASKHSQSTSKHSLPKISFSFLNSHSRRSVDNYTSSSIAIVPPTRMRSASETTEFVPPPKVPKLTIPLTPKIIQVANSLLQQQQQEQQRQPEKPESPQEQPQKVHQLQEQQPQKMHQPQEQQPQKMHQLQEQQPQKIHQPQEQQPQKVHLPQEQQPQKVHLPQEQQLQKVHLLQEQQLQKVHLLQEQQLQKVHLPQEQQLQKVHLPQEQQLQKVHLPQEQQLQKVHLPQEQQLQKVHLPQEQQLQKVHLPQEQQLQKVHLPQQQHPQKMHQPQKQQPQQEMPEEEKLDSKDYDDKIDSERDLFDGDPLVIAEPLDDFDSKDHKLQISDDDGKEDPLKKSDKLEEEIDVESCEVDSGRGSDTSCRTGDDDIGSPGSSTTVRTPDLDKSNPFLIPSPSSTASLPSPVSTMASPSYSIGNICNGLISATTAPMTTVTNGSTVTSNSLQNHQKDSLCPLDLSICPRKRGNDRLPLPRPRQVANPPVLDKHRQTTPCLPLPSHPSFKLLPAVLPHTSIYKKNSSSDFCRGNFRCKGSTTTTLTAYNPDPSSSRPKIVIKSIESPRAEHGHGRHHHHHHHSHHHQRI